MAGRNSIQIFRGSETFDPTTSNEVLLDGLPFYSKKTKELYIGDGTSALSSLKGTYIGLKLDKAGVVAKFSDTIVTAETISELLLTLYEGFNHGTYTVPNDKTITYNVYGYNEFSGHLFQEIGENIDFSINDIFETVKILGYNNAEIKFCHAQQGPTFLFAKEHGEYNPNVYISNVSFYNDTPKATAWEGCYFRFHVGYNGTLSIDNCLFLENGLQLQYGVTNSIINCRFNSINSSRYALWVGKNAFGKGYTDTLQDVTIDNCTFTGYRGIKILTDTKTTSTYVVEPRDNQSINIQNCVFKDITNKAAVVIDCQLADRSSFTTGESKLKIKNTTFVNCAVGNIIIDEDSKDKKIQYLISNEVVLEKSTYLQNYDINFKQNASIDHRKIVLTAESNEGANGSLQTTYGNGYIAHTANGQQYDENGDPQSEIDYFDVEIKLPTKSGILALTSDIPTISDNIFIDSLFQ